MKRVLLPPMVSICLLLCTVAQAQTVRTLTPLSSFGNAGDGTLQPGSMDPYPLLDTGNNQRGIAFDPTSGKVVLVNTSSGSGGSSTVMGNIYVLDGTYGTNVGTLSVEGISGGNYADASAGVADDGVVYIANLVNASSSNPLIVYRWDSTASASPPLMVFSNTITPNQRYGTSMDVRGAGTNTQIIFGSMRYNSTSGTNVVILTTADGTNFSATSLATDRKAPNFDQGIAFGAGNTFWAKTTNAPLLLMSFDLATATATTLKALDTSVMPESQNLGPLAVDTNLNLLGAIEVNATAAERVFLYDIADSSRPPVLLDVKEYPQNNDNAWAPSGYLRFGGGRLYSHAINNGMYVFNVATVPIPSPTIVLQPVPAVRRITTGQSATYSVAGYPAVSYQWRKNLSNIPNATNAVLSITNAATTDSGTYSVVVSNPAGSLASSNATLTVVAPTDLYHLNQIWSVAPDAAPYMITSGGSKSVPNQRTLAFNAASNELYIISRSGSSYPIYAINGTNVSLGAPPPVVKTLNTNGISGGLLTLVAVAVAGDGAIYACNEDFPTNQVTHAWKLYRWANSDSNTAPTLVFSGDPAFSGLNARWGDAMDVRGSGPGTQIVIDNQNISATGNRLVAVLTPSDTFMTNFTSVYNNLEAYGGNSIIGRSLQWGAGNTIWQKRPSRPLIQSTVDLANFGGTAVSNLSLTLPSNLGPVWLDQAHNLAFEIRTNSGAPFLLNMYDVTEPTSPVFIAAYNFPKNPGGADDNYIAQCVVSGDYIFALASQNGMMGFKIVYGPPTAPNFVLQPQNLRLVQGGSGTLSVTVDQTGAAYQWQKEGVTIAGATNSSFSISNAQFSDAAGYRCIATNAYGSGTSAVATVTVASPDTLYHLVPIWSNAVGTQPYLSFSTDANTPFNRSIAYSAVSNQLYLVNRTSGTGGLTVNVLDPDTGNKLYELNTTGISTPANGAPNIILVQMAAGPDGAIYAGNACVTSGNTAIAEYHLYRWTNSDPSTVPVLVYSGEPSGSSTTLRWGDTLDVRNSGMNTEVIVDEGNSALLASVLVPTDNTLTTFTNKVFTQIYGAGPIGRATQFGPTNTIWQKRKGLPLKLTRYDAAAGSGTLLASYGNFPSTVGGLTLDLGRKLAAGVDFTGSANTSPDTLALFEISDLNAPMLIARYNFPTNEQGNANFIGQAIFAGNRVYAVDANNGIVGFALVPPQPELTIQLRGNTVVLSWPGAFTGYTLEATADVTAPNSWVPLGAGGLSGDQFFVTNSIDASARYYRLRQ